MRYICTCCGYIYDPEKGDPLNEIAAGTSFEDLPEAWVCPLCYAEQESFDPLD
ncbi:MAG: rubredoxin [Desulfuromonadales bacterium]|nr:rubredoxin [Desulfuromonadales bacterium]